MLESMFESGIVGGVVAGLSIAIVLIYFKIKKVPLKEAMNSKSFIAIFITVMFLLFIGIKYLQKELNNTYMNDTEVKTVKETEQGPWTKYQQKTKTWTQTEINKVKKYYINLYNDKLLNTMFKDHKDNMISTANYLMNTISNRATDCVMKKINKDYKDFEYYKKNEPFLKDSYFVNSCLTNNLIEDTYKELSTSWNKYTEMEIKDSAKIGIDQNKEFQQLFKKYKIDIVGEKLISKKSSICLYNKLQKEYPNYETFGNGFHKTKNVKILKKYNSLLEECISNEIVNHLTN